MKIEVRGTTTVFVGEMHEQWVHDTQSGFRAGLDDPKAAKNIANFLGGVTEEEVNSALKELKNKFK